MPLTFHFIYIEINLSGVLQSDNRTAERLAVSVGVKSSFLVSVKDSNLKNGSPFESVST